MRVFAVMPHRDIASCPDAAPALISRLSAKQDAAVREAILNSLASPATIHR